MLLLFQGNATSDLSKTNEMATTSHVTIVTCTQRLSSAGCIQPDVVQLHWYGMTVNGSATGHLPVANAFITNVTDRTVADLAKHQLTLTFLQPSESRSNLHIWTKTSFSGEMLSSNDEYVSKTSDITFQVVSISFTNNNILFWIWLYCYCSTTLLVLLVVSTVS